MNDAYKVEMLSRDNIVERVAQIFALNDDEKSLEHIEWQYLKNPAGVGYTAMAVSRDGRDAAVYSVIKVNGEINGQRIDVVQSIDTLTDKDHRGKGLFTKLSNAVYEACDRDHVHCVYGFPNSNSAPGFFRKLGWENLGYPPFRFYLCNLSFPLGYLINKRLPRIPNFLAFTHTKILLKRILSRESWTLHDGVDFDSKDYSELWEKMSTLQGLKVSRHGEYMNWRYKQKPGVHYQYISLKGEDGYLIGVVVFRLVEKHRGFIGYVMDVIADPENGAVLATLLRASAIQCCEKGADVVFCWVPRELGLASSYSRALFVPLPRRLQPIKLHFGLRQFSDSTQVVGTSSVFISYADSDTV